VDFWNGSSNSWENRHDDSQGIDDDWYSYRYGDWNIDGYNLHGTFVDEYFCTADFKLRMTGTDYYVDDLWICSLEYIPDTVPPTYLDNSNETAGTGDTFTFRVNASDDVRSTTCSWTGPTGIPAGISPWTGPAATG